MSGKHSAVAVMHVQCNLRVTESISQYVTVIFMKQLVDVETKTSSDSDNNH